MPAKNTIRHALGERLAPLLLDLRALGIALVKNEAAQAEEEAGLIWVALRRGIGWGRRGRHGP